MAERPGPRQTGPHRWVVIMAKEPRAGAVKTRLACDIGGVAALRFYRTTMRGVMRRLMRPRRWRTVVAVTPGAAATSPAFGSASRIRQGAGDLGARLQRVFSAMPPGPVVIIGTDIPEIGETQIARAFRLLGGHDAVLGPSADGGYWLIGLRRSPRIRRIFSRVRWSSAHTLEDTLANLANASTGILERLDDVDDGESYRRLAAAGARVVPPLRRNRSG